MLFCGGQQYYTGKYRFAEEEEEISPPGHENMWHENGQISRLRDKNEGLRRAEGRKTEMQFQKLEKKEEGDNKN